MNKYKNFSSSILIRVTTQGVFAALVVIYKYNVELNRPDLQSIYTLPKLFVLKIFSLALSYRKAEGFSSLPKDISTDTACETRPPN